MGTSLQFPPLSIFTSFSAGSCSTINVVIFAVKIRRGMFLLRRPITFSSTARYYSLCLWIHRFRSVSHSHYFTVFSTLKYTCYMQHTACHTPFHAFWEDRITLSSIKDLAT
jgi:hypothetical protein